MNKKLEKLIKGKLEVIETDTDVCEILEKDFGYEKEDLVKQNTYGIYYTYLGEGKRIVVCKYTDNHFRVYIED